MAYNEAYRNTDDLQCVDLNWSNQLEMFKIAFDADDLVIRYLDEENEEVGLNNQQDYEYAIQLAGAKGFINLVFKDKSGKTLSKRKFFINKEDTDLKTNKIQIKQDVMPVNRDEWLVTYLDKFKHDILNEMETKITEIVLNHSKNDRQHNALELMSESCELRSDRTFEENVSNLLKMLIEVRYVDRPLKKAYLEEELELTGAFQAEFVTDINIPDGTKCLPNHKFQKQWLIKNTGKLAWSNPTNPDTQFPAQLFCTGGNISTLSKSDERVNIAYTKCDDQIQVSVNLVAPSEPGEFYTEWALVCKGFQFGPRLWCAIEVIESESSSEHRFCEEDDDDFVVVPDCLDLTKKWKPDFDLLVANDENLANDLENSYIEVSDRLTQTLGDLADNYNYIENVNVVQEANMVQENKKNDVPDLIHLTNEEPIVVKNEYVLPEDNSPTNCSKFDMIKKSFANLKGPSNIGDTQVDFSQIANPLPQAASNILPIINNLPIRRSLNNSVTTITNAIGSLGSVYQSSNTQDQTEKNMHALISMGFANRTLNGRLLSKYSGDMDKVLEKLLESSDNDWHEHR